MIELEVRAPPRIGVYVCHCGLNIANVVNVKEVVEYAKTLPNVVIAKDYIFMCSTPGQNLIKEDIKEKEINRIVIAACSPSFHEPTFRRACKEAGLNPYLLEMVNIREHCSWVHMEEKHKATEKAKDLVRMGIARAALLEPLEEIRVKVEPSALILGGGVAGLRAAVDLVKRGFNVYLVEKSPVLGGITSRLAKVAGFDVKGIEVVNSLLEDIKSNSKIIFYLNSDLIELKGSIGSFQARIRVRPRFVDERCNLCGKCADVCPVEVPNEYEYGLINRKAIYIPFDGAFPPIYVIDPYSCNRCGRCVEVCETGAINLEMEEREEEVTVGGVIVATGFQPYEPPDGELGYRKSRRVLTLPQVERMLDESGPTGGKMEFDGFSPRNVAFILCVGSLGTTESSAAYCSRVCCISSLKTALMIKDKWPETEIYFIYKDMRAYGAYEKLYQEALERLIKFILTDELPILKVDPNNVEILVYEKTIGEYLLLPVDLVILGTGVLPSKDLPEISKILRLSRTPDGFLREAHLKLRPVESPSGGIYLAGSVTGPKSIVESIAAGSAAAAKLTALLARREVEVEPITVYVEEDRCIGCGLCEDICEFGAIRVEKKTAKVIEASCRGCGLCAASCPNSALRIRHYKFEQIMAQIREVSG